MDAAYLARSRTDEEVIAISRAVGQHGGMLQSVIESGKLDEELALMKQQLTALRHPVAVQRAVGAR